MTYQCTEYQYAVCLTMYGGYMWTALPYKPVVGQTLHFTLCDAEVVEVCATIDEVVARTIELNKTRGVAQLAERSPCKRKCAAVTSEIRA